MNDSRKQTTTTSSSMSNVSSFPAKLHFMLNELKRDNLEYVASWQQHGRCFIVRKPKEFESMILPCYFQQSKVTSFQRQLSFYGFRRIVSGQDKGGYFHEHFLRGREELASMIQRTKIKGSGPRKPNSMESPTPNFYEKPFLYEKTKNNINQDSDEKKQQELSSQQTIAKMNNVNTNEINSPRLSTTQTIEGNIPEGIAMHFSKRNVDDEDTMILKINHQERLDHVQLLNELDRETLLFFRSTYATIKDVLQARASSQVILSNFQQRTGRQHNANEFDCLRNMKLSSSCVSCDNYPMSKGSSMFPSLTYHELAVSSTSSPFACSSSSHDRTSGSRLHFSISGVTPSSSSISSDVICLALVKYFQQKSSGEFFG